VYDSEETLQYVQKSLETWLYYHHYYFAVAGCLCVYDSEETLQYVQKSLETWLVWQGDRDHWLAHGMPFVLMQAAQPSASLKQLSFLRDMGMQLAHR
jgi:hypothetical protein